LYSRHTGYAIERPIADGKTIVGLLSNKHTYFPEVSDFVVGVVRFKSQINYHLDINSSLDGVLGELEFNGATKRNKPNLQIGSCIFCQVSETPKYLNPRLTCITTEKKEWTTGETKLCELKKCNLVYLPSSCLPYLEKILPIMSKHVSFEVALGKNVVVWLSTSRVKNLIIISNLINSINLGSIDNMLSLFDELFEK
jgi:exosome complex component RRP40